MPTGCTTLPDFLLSLRRMVSVKEFPLMFAPRGGGESKLDQAVAFEFLIGLYDRYLGKILPTRFALFGTIGAAGVLEHMAILASFLHWYSGEHYVFGRWITKFDVGQTIAAIVAMTFTPPPHSLLSNAHTRLNATAILPTASLRFALTRSAAMLANTGAAAA